MRALLPIAEAFLAASVAPAIAYAILSMSARTFVPVFVVAFAHALLLGVPLYGFLHWKKWTSFVPTVFGAFLIGSVPIAILAWPRRFSEFKSSTSDSTWGRTMIDGVPTTAGWLSFTSLVLTFGAFGVVGGIVFWYYLRLRRKKLE